ncbi:MAG: hypothetical protein AAB803_00590 [Patescibacteria group bacterium]
MNKWLVGLIVLVAGGVVGWYVLQAQKPKEEMTKFTSDQSAAPTQKEDAATGAGGVVEKDGVPAQVDKAMERTAVMYADSGFSPREITVKKGTNVSFLNQSSKGMWVASALHPTHQLLPGFDQLKSAPKGGTYEYTFDKVGTWKYHNHVAASDTGTVVVTE